MIRHSPTFRQPSTLVCGVWGSSLKVPALYFWHLKQQVLCLGLDIKKDLLLHPESLKALLTGIQMPSSSVWLLLVSFASGITIPSLLTHSYAVWLLRLLPSPLTLPSDPEMGWLSQFQYTNDDRELPLLFKMNQCTSLTPTKIKTWGHSCTKSAQAMTLLSARYGTQVLSQLLSAYCSLESTE